MPKVSGSITVETVVSHDGDPHDVVEAWYWETIDVWPKDGKQEGEVEAVVERYDDCSAWGLVTVPVSIECPRSSNYLPYLLNAVTIEYNGGALGQDDFLFHSVKLDRVEG